MEPLTRSASTIHPPLSPLTFSSSLFVSRLTFSLTSSLTLSQLFSQIHSLSFALSFRFSLSSSLSPPPPALSLSNLLTPLRSLLSLYLSLFSPSPQAVIHISLSLSHLSFLTLPPLTLSLFCLLRLFSSLFSS
ncbi:hypothetical protein WMY93_031263 [Mugilogobius chulae]|uniref:Uncharacterized protein n=1 Tax=Mugilogobius chulae TaxID=88201 RepID=A0AAW0MIF7_9GOBI